jgi:putative alpha-1,2-mannosidase
MEILFFNNVFNSFFSIFAKLFNTAKFHSMQRTFYLLGFVILCFITGCNSVSKPPVDYVNPLIGVGEHGHIFPGAIVPFGMVRLNPDTRLDGWDGSGYHDSDDVIFGFSHTYLSGKDCSDYGDILLMPTTGVLQLSNGKDNVSKGYASHFSHENEKAAAG